MQKDMSLTYSALIATEAFINKVCYVFRYGTRTDKEPQDLTTLGSGVAGKLKK